MGPFFFLLDFFGLFRSDPLEEMVGLDESRHKGSVYDETGRATKDDVDALNTSRHSNKAKGAKTLEDA